MHKIKVVQANEFQYSDKNIMTLVTLADSFFLYILRKGMCQMTGREES